MLSIGLFLGGSQAEEQQALAARFGIQTIPTMVLFKGGREGSLWYHRRMAEALSTGWHHPILALLREELGRLHETAGREQAGRG